MGRSSKKQLTELETLQLENKELRSINKSLSRKLKEENKKYKPTHNKEKLDQEEFDEKTTCKECGKGILKIMELGPRKFLFCSIGCGFKQKIDGKEKEETEKIQPEI